MSLERLLLLACAALLAIGARACAVSPGYTFLSGSSVPDGVAVLQVTGDNATSSLAKACSLRADCTGFSSTALVLGAVAAWPAQQAGAAECEGVYVRGALVGNGMTNEQVTGMEVSSEFDLAAPYYSHVIVSDCLALCTRTPGCRSISYLSFEQVCRLKTATCAEARLGKGCIQHATRQEAFYHIDLATTVDFVTSSWIDATAFLALTSQPSTFDAASAACAQLGSALPSLHAQLNLNTLIRATERAYSVNSGGSSAGAGPQLFWLGGTHVPAQGGSGSIAWLDGTRYLLQANFTVAAPGGCLALTVQNATSASLVVQPCDATGFPMCLYFPDGFEASRFQTESTAVVLYDVRTSHQDGANFCNRMGGRLFRPNSTRGLQILLDAAYATPEIGNLWMDGICSGTECKWSNGQRIDSSITRRTAADEVMNTVCLLLNSVTPWSLSSATLTGLTWGSDCGEQHGVACEFFPSFNTSSRDLPARVRLHGGSAYLFFASGRAFSEARAMCQLIGGDLASVQDAATDALIADTWYDIDPPSNDFKTYSVFNRRHLTYLGADSLGGRGMQWLDGTPFAYNGAWFSATAPSNEGCLVMTSLGSQGPSKWEVKVKIECPVTRINYTCKASPKAYVQPDAVFTRPGANSTWELFNSIPRTLNNAREACRARGGDLVSLDFFEDLEPFHQFVTRLRHEVYGYIPIMGDLWHYYTGAIANKSGSSVIYSDFKWLDGTPFNWLRWPETYPLDSPVEFRWIPDDVSAGMIMSYSGNAMLTRRRPNFSMPFACEAPIVSLSVSEEADDGTVYEVVSTPYALPYHAAEQVCQARGGHLAGATSVLQLNVIGQMCSQALQALPRAFNGGFVSHDVEDGCWVGLYCPSGYTSGVSHNDGFGESGLKGVAVSQPAVLHISNCSSASDLLWLDGRTAAAELASAMSAAGSTVSPSQRCGLVQRTSTDANTTSLVMAPCKQFAAFVCERRAVPAAVQPALNLQQSTVEPATSSSTLPIEYVGCFAFIPSITATSGNSTASSLALSPPPLPVLLSQDADSMSLCKGLTLAEGATYFAIVDGHNCWVGKELPTAPFLAVDDDRPCRQQCAGDEASDSPPPSCSLPGYAAVHLTKNSGNQTVSPVLQGPTAFVCMAQQQLAAPNATLVGQLHVSVSELSSCEKVCTSLGRCDFYTYDTRAGACLLLGVPTVDNLASLSVYDALWAATTCVKAPRLVSGAALQNIPLHPVGVAKHVCSPNLRRVLAASGVEADTPSNKQRVGGLPDCASACASNATCQGFAVNASPSSDGNSTGLMCNTYTGIVMDQGVSMLPTRPWMQLDVSTAGPAASGDVGCLPLSRLEPPPRYFCADGEDAAGTEMKRFLANSTTSVEQQCRDACNAEAKCSLYVVYSSPPSCSIRYRAFYGGGSKGVTDGSRVVGNNSRLAGAKSCLHSYRVLTPLVSPAVGRTSRQIRIGSDSSWHLCVPHMDLRGLDKFSVDTFVDTRCASECSLDPSCTYFITTYDAYETGVCYTKKDPVFFDVGAWLELPSLGGWTRMDMVSVADSCINMERQLPRDLPSYVCAQQYAAAFVARSRTTASTAAACEALCDAAADSCSAYTWMAHNSTCVLGGGRVPDGSTMTLAAWATGPSSLATHTCVHAPRFMSDGLSSPAAGQHVQASSVWSYCVTQAGSTAPPPDLVVKVVAALPATANASASFPAVRACAQLCFTTLGCQLYTLVWRSAIDASPTCVLQGWSSATPLATPAMTVSSGSSTANSGAQSLVCLPMSAKHLFAATSGILYPQMAPSTLQAYRTKQYTVHVLPAMYNIATLVCQKVGGLLATVNSQQELTVLANLLRPYVGWQVQPAAGVPLQPVAFWTGLQRGGPRSCSGYCSTYSRTTNASFVDTLTVLPGGNGSSLACGALVPQANPTIGAALLPGDCASWELPFVCEIGMAPLAVGGASPYAPVQLFPVRVGYDGAVSQATAAGAVVATLDLSAPPVQAGRRLLSSGRVLAADSTPTGARFTDLSSAMAACGTTQLRGSGCWVQLQPPASACGANTSLAALCGAKALLMLAAASTTAANVRGLAGLAGSSGSGSCAAALQPESTTTLGVSPAYSLAPCSTPAAFLAAVVDPEYAVRNLQASPPPQHPPPSVPPPALPVSSPSPPPLVSDALAPSSSDSGLSSGAIAGIVVGAVLGIALAVLLLLLLLRKRKRERSDASMPAPASSKGVPTDQLSDKAPSSLDPASGAQDGKYGSQDKAPSVMLYQSQRMSMGSTSQAVPGSLSSVDLKNANANSHNTGVARLLQQHHQLVVTAEDPDQGDVTWSMDLDRDIMLDSNDPIGNGTFGVVYRGVYKGEPVAIKTVMRGANGKFDLDGLRSLLHEARILAKVRHPNVVTCYGGCISDQNVFIVEELMVQNLAQLIGDTGDPASLLPLSNVMRIGMDIANGLFQLHPTIVHRDLKPDNVLLDAAGKAKISDFGLARFKMRSYLASTQNFAAGTLPFMAPESFHEEVGMISEKADIYSLGVILWTMLTGRQQPWQKFHYAAIMYKVSIQGERPPLPEDPARCPPRLAALLKRMWAQDPQVRPGAGDVLKSLGIILRELPKSSSAQGASGPQGAASQEANAIAAPSSGSSSFPVESGPVVAGGSGGCEEVKAL